MYSHPLKPRDYINLLCRQAICYSADSRQLSLFREKPLTKDYRQSSIKEIRKRGYVMTLEVDLTSDEQCLLSTGNNIVAVIFSVRDRCGISLDEAKRIVLAHRDQFTKKSESEAR